MAEGVLHMSGVLATVASSLVLADHMWPHLVSKETLMHFWHCVEEIMNIIIFTLAGSLCGAVMVHIEYIDYANLLVIYVVLTVCRGLLIFGSSPLMKYLSYDGLPVSYADCAVMTWGGLRGAVGLALAIQVQRGLAQDLDGVPQITEEQGQRVMFFVGGVAFLTTIVNAPTCPFLVSLLGITELPHSKELWLKKFTHRLLEISHSEKHPIDVTEALKHLVHEIDEDIHSRSKKVQKAVQKAENNRLGQAMAHKLRADAKLSKKAIEESQASMIKAQHNAACQVFKALPNEDLEKLRRQFDFSLQHLADGTSNMYSVIDSAEPVFEMNRVVTRTFINTVKAAYEKQILDGDMFAGSPEASILFMSLTYAISTLKKTMLLCDFEYVNASVIDDEVLLGRAQAPEIPDQIHEYYRKHGQRSGADLAIAGKATDHTHLTHVPHYGDWMHMMNDHLKHMDGTGAVNRTLGRIVGSGRFTYGCIAAIMLNCVFVVVDEVVRNEENRSNPVWITLECIFAGIFVFEAAVKTLHSPHAYFKDLWNRFDFFLALLGAVGAGLSVYQFVEESAHKGSFSQLSKEGRVIRVARVLRTARFLRVFRLFHARMSADNHVSIPLALQMHKVITLQCFIKGHVKAQQAIMKYFVGPHQVSYVEVARVLLQSQAAVHKALVAVAQIERTLDEELLRELKNTKVRKHIAEGLEVFVQEAEDCGAISPLDAHSILHPLHGEIASCLKFIHNLDEGIVDSATKRLSLVRASVRDDEGVEANVPGEKEEQLTIPIDDEAPINFHTSESTHIRL